MNIRSIALTLIASIGLTVAAFAGAAEAAQFTGKNNPFLAQQQMQQQRIAAQRKAALAQSQQVRRVSTNQNFGPGGPTITPANRFIAGNPAPSYYTPQQFGPGGPTITCANAFLCGR